MHLFRKSLGFIFFSIFSISLAFAQSPVATRFIVTESGGDLPLGTTAPLQSGVEVAVRITAVDSSGQPVPGYARRLTITLPDPLVDDELQVTQTVLASEFDVNGFADNILITPVHAGTDNRRIAVTDGNIATYNANVDELGVPALFSVSPASFYVGVVGTSRSLSNSLVVDSLTEVRLFAVNSDNTIATGYTGTVTLDSSAFSAPWDVDILFGGFIDTYVFFESAGDDQIISASDGITLTDNASGTFDIQELTFTGGIDQPESVVVEESDVLRAGDSFTLEFELKANEDLEVDSGADFGTISTVQLFNRDYSITYYIRSPKLTPASSADDGSVAFGSFTIPQYFAPGLYTLRIKSGGVGQNTDSDITLAGLPDLAIERFDYAPGNYEAGESMRFDLAWSNRTYSPGSNERNALVPLATGYQYRVEIHLSLDEEFGNEDDILVWNQSYLGNTQLGDLDAEFIDLSPLLIGQGMSIEGELKFPENLPGTYYLLAKVNSGGGPDGDFSTGFLEEEGPAPGPILYDGNNVVTPSETQKITIVPRTSSETLRVSTTTEGIQVVGHSDQAVVSRNGSYVAFQSLANLAASNQFPQIFLKDVAGGQVSLVSANGGALAGNGTSSRPAISEDGRYVAFESAASDLIPGDRNGFSDIFIRDMQDGVTKRISINGVSESNGGSFKPSLSATGRFVVFSSRASNLVSLSTSGFSQIYLLDRDVSNSGTFDIAGNTAFSLVSSNAGVAGLADSVNPKLSSDGDYVVFSTSARNLHGDSANPMSQIVRWERSSGALLTVSASLYGEIGDLADGNCDFASVSKTLVDPDTNDEVSHVVFVSRSLNLTDPSLDVYEAEIPHVFRATISNGVVTNVVRVNGSGNVEPNNPPTGYISSPDLGGFEPSISEDGNLIVFASESDNLLGPISVRHLDRTTYLSDNIQNHADQNRVADVYLADLSNIAAPVIQRVSVSSFGYEATLRTVGTTVTTRVPSSRAPAISPDGRYVVYTSDAEFHNGLIFGQTNFDYLDTNASRDIYLLDRKTSGSTTPSNLPSATLLLPSALTVTTGSTIPLSVLATSASRGIASVEFYANNFLIGFATQASVDGTGIFVVNWLTPNLGAGNPQTRVYEIAAVAVDTNGVRSLVSNSTRVSVLPLNTSAVPTITLSASSPQAFIRSGSTVRLIAQVSDADRNFSAVEFFVNGQSIGSVDSTHHEFFPDRTLASYTINWTNSGVGSYILFALARDAAGNQAVSNPMSIEVAPTVKPGIPAITLVTPASNTSLKIGDTLHLVTSVTDAAGVIDQVWFVAHGVQLNPITEQEEPITITFDADDDAPYEGDFFLDSFRELGTYEIYAVALDVDGNQTSSNSIIVNVTSEIDPVLLASTNNLFVYQVLLDGEQHQELNPGDPIKYTVAYGRHFPTSGEHNVQSFRVHVYLSTDGNPDNPDNFELGFFNNIYPREVIGRFEYQVMTSMLPPHFTGTYFIVPVVRSDDTPGNNFPAYPQTGTARITIRPADAPAVSRVSVTPEGGNPVNFSESGVISSDGRYVVFQSESTDIVASPVVPVGISQIYLRDTLTNVTTLVSQRGGVAGNAESKYASISVLGSNAGGMHEYYVAYQSAATNLIGGTGNLDTNAKTDVFLYELTTGSTTRISVPSGAPSGMQANNGSYMPSVSGNGDYIVFESDASNLVASTALQDTNGQRDIYLYDRRSRAVTPISTTASGVFGAGASTQPQISEDGLTVVFRSFGRNLAGSLLPANHTRSVIYAKTRPTGVVTPISVMRESLASGSATYTAFNADAFDPAVSADGRHVAFASRANNVPSYPGSPYTNAGKYSQVYVVNRAVDATGPVSVTNYDQVGKVALSLVSSAIDPVTGLIYFGEDESLAPVINGSGRYIGFRTEASNLQPLEVVRSDGVRFPTRSILFHFDQNNTSDVYLRDTGITTYQITNPGAGYPASEGIPFIIETGGGIGAQALAIIEDGVVSRVDILDSGAGYTTAPSAITLPGGTTQAVITPIIQTSSDRISVSHFGMETIGIIGSPSVPSSRDLAISSDGRYMVFTSDAHNSAGFVFGKSNLHPLDTNSKRDVFMVDRRTSTASHALVGILPTVTLSISQDNATTGSQVLVYANAGDRGDIVYGPAGEPSEVSGSITSLQIFANGQALTPLVAPVLGVDHASATGVFTAPRLLGPVEFYAVTSDLNGNVVFSSRLTVTVRSSTLAAPSVVLAGPVPATASIGQSVLFSATTTSAVGATIQRVDFYSNGVLAGTDTAAPFTLAYSAAQAGLYSLQAVVTDSSGNTAVSGSIDLMVSAPVPPTVSISAGAASVSLGSTLAISATASDSDGTISRVVFNEFFGSVTGTPSRSVEDRLLPYGYQFTPAQVGIYLIVAEASDNQGNTTSSSALQITVTPNMTPPVVEFIVPAPVSSAVVGQETTLEVSVNLATGASVNSVSFYSNGTLIGTGNRQGQLDRYRFIWQPSVTGTFVLNAEVVDSYGGRAETLIGRVLSVVAQTGSLPFVEIIQPVPPEATGGDTPASFITTSNSDLNLVASAVDSDGSVTSVEFFLDRGRHAVATATITDSSVLTPGIGFIGGITLIDAGANYLSPPTVFIDGDGVGATAEAEIQNGSIRLIRVTNRGAGYTNAQLRFVGGGLVEGLSLGLAARDFSSDVWRLPTPFNFKTYGSGFYGFRAVAKDNNSNAQSSATVFVTAIPAPLTTPVTGLVTSTPATADVDGQRVPAGQTIQLSISPTVTGGSIASVEFFANGESVGIDTASPFIINWVPSYVASYSVLAVVTDSAGNRGVSPIHYVYVGGNVAPTITLVRPSLTGSTGVVNQAVMLEAEASALTPGATISSVEFIADGESVGVAQQVGSTNRFVLSTWRPATSKIYGITARVVDSFGQIAQTASRALTVLAQRGVVPTVVMSSPSGAGTGTGGEAGVTVSNNSTLYLAARANDADGSVTNVEFLLSRGQPATATALLFETGTSINTITVTSAGSGYLYAPRVNIVGNGVGALAEAIVTNGAVTSVRVISRGSGYTSTPQIIFEGGGLYENLVVGSATQTPGTLSWTSLLDLRNYDVGPYFFSARVTDNNGNTAISVPVAVNVTAATVGAPVITLSAVVPSTATLGQSVNIYASPMAAVGASITNVDFYANGTLIGSVEVAPYILAYVAPSAGSYTISAIATDSAGNSAVSTSNLTLTVNALTTTPAMEVIDDVYQTIHDRSPTSEEILAAVAKFGTDVTRIELANRLIQSSGFRDLEAELLLSFLAVWGRYPNPSEFTDLRAQVAAGLTDAEIINGLLNSAAYSTRYGNVADLSVVSTNQYNQIRAFALRSYQNLNGKAATGVTVNVIAKQFFTFITLNGTGTGTGSEAGTTSAAAEALLSYRNFIFNGGENSALMSRLRVAGAMLLIKDEEPSRALVEAFVSRPFLALLDYLFAEDAFYAAGSNVLIPTATGTEPDGTTFYASGLPKGLRMDKNTGVISGQLPASIKIYTYSIWTQSIGGVRGAVRTRLLVTEALPSKFVGGNEALLRDDVGNPAGKVSFRVTKTASYTGSLVYSDGKTYSFRGVLALNGTDVESATATGVHGLIKRKAPLSILELGILFDDDGKLTAWVAEGEDSDPIATAAGEDSVKTITYTTKAPAPWKSTTKVNLLDIDSQFTDGAGNGTLKVNYTGVLSSTFVGADGSKITGSAHSSNTSDYRLYSRPYAKKPTGYFAGSLTLSDDETPADVNLQDADFLWMRPEGLAPYPDGFGPIAIGMELSTTP